MAKQANKMMIGGFVLIAIFIMAASLVIFGSGKFFKKTNKYLLFFDESVKGLSVGAPVLFQGVQIGSVISIEIQTDIAKLKTQIPVIIEIEPEKWHAGEEAQNMSEEQRKSVATKLIEKGLRAVLTMQSLITGQMAIELDFFSNSAICYIPAKVDPNYKNYIVIPTCQSTGQKLVSALEKLDIGALQKKLEAGLDGIDKLVNNPNLAPSIQSLKETLQSTHKLISRVDGKIDPLTKNVNKTVKDFGRLADDLDVRVKELTTSLNKTLTSLDGTMTGMKKTMTGVQGVISPDAPLVVDLENSLQRLARMSEAIRELADYLEAHPSSIIRGKTKPKGE